MPNFDVTTSLPLAERPNLAPKAPVKKNFAPAKAKAIPNPAVPPTSGCPLLQKLPAELRLEIFGHVLESRHSVLNVNHLHDQPWKQGHLFDTPLFAVSKLISAEAEEVFYKLNTIRVKSLNDDYKNRKLTRYLELTGDVITRICLWPGAKESNSAAGILAHLPNLRTLTFSEDELDGPLPPLGPNAPTALSQKTTADDTSGFKLVDYGVRKYQTRVPSFAAFFKHFRLMDAVAYARELGPDIALADLRDRYDKLLDQKKQHEAARALFVLWLYSFEVWRAKERGVTVSVSEQVTLDTSFFIVSGHEAGVEALIEKLPGGTRLVDLTVAEHGEKTIEMANRLLHGHLPLPSEMEKRY